MSNSRSQYVITYDVAKKQDASTLQIWRDSPEFIKGNNELYLDDKTFHYFDLVFQTRMEMISYVDQARMIANLCGSEALKNDSDFLIDATGVGEPVVDIIKEFGLRPTPIVFTGGMDLTIKYEEQGRRFGGFGAGIGTMRTIAELCVPKNDMIAAAQTMLQQFRPRIAPDVEYQDQFKEQLVHFKGKVNENTGYTSFNNDNPNIHDDFITTFIMAMWWFKYRGYMKDEQKVVKDKQQSYNWDPLGSPENF